ncbi:MAG: histidine--tRNA ligase [Desulfurococcaceae archaeon]
MSAFDLNPPRGTRDLVGREAKVFMWLFEEFKKTAEARGFEPIITPTIEYSRLFELKSGEEIKRTMYVFEDKGGRLIALRPEVTASVVRAYLRALRGEPKPIRLYYIAQCFRYDEPQRARYREFWQGGLEVIGDPDVNADVAAAEAASRFLEGIGLEHYYAVGNVAPYRAFMGAMGVPSDDQDHILHLIDKGRVEDAVKFAGEKYGTRLAELLKKLISTKLEDLERLVEEHGELLGAFRSHVESEVERTVAFIEVLSELGYRATYDPLLVRGLAYYTGLIFEYKTPRLDVSIGGGGRYDGLTSVYREGVFEYSTGLALGIDRIALALGESTGAFGGASKVLVITTHNVPLSSPYKIARRIADLGFSVSVHRSDDIGKALRLANRLNVKLVVIYGRRELERQSVILKDMATGTQYEFKIDDERLLEMLRRSA